MSSLEIRNWVHGLALLAVLGGCGGESEPATKDPGNTGGSGGSAGGVSAGGNPSAGSQTTAGSSGAGSAGASTVGSCRGSFGPAFPVLVEELGAAMNGISLTGDELELYYARGDLGARTVVRRKRNSKSEGFGAVEPLPELAGVCGATHPHLNPDITDDGLTLYVTCTQEVENGMSEGPSPLRVARRPDRNAAFTLETAAVGNVFASAGISADELTAFTDGEIFDSAPRMFTRASKAENFGEPQPVPGIDTPLRSPDISNDGLALFGSATPASGSGTMVHRALRPTTDAAFAPLEPLSLQLPMLGVGAPTITPSCTLYVILVQPASGYAMYAAVPQ